MLYHLGLPNFIQHSLRTLQFCRIGNVCFKIKFNNTWKWMTNQAKFQLNIKSISLNWLLITKILPFCCAHVRQVFGWTNVCSTPIPVHTHTQESVGAGSVANTRCKYRCQTVITFISDAILFFVPVVVVVTVAILKLQSKWDYMVSNVRKFYHFLAFICETNSITIH